MNQNHCRARRLAAWSVCTIGLLGAAFFCWNESAWSNQPVAQPTSTPNSSTRGGDALPLVEPGNALLRRPVAVVNTNADQVVVANRRSGTLSMVDTETLQVLGEYRLGGRPTDLIAVGERLLITEQDGRLTAVQMKDGRPAIQWSVAMPNEPATVRASDQGEWCAVCSTWARKVTFVNLQGPADQPPEIMATVSLPFAPRAQLLLPDQNRLLVADAFGPRVAVIRLDDFQVESIREIPGNNIRGFVRSTNREMVYVTHELINEIAPPRSSEIIWGSMVSDAMREISVATIVDPNANLMKAGRFIAVGNNTRGAGDPNALMMREDGRLVVTIGGLGQVGVVEPGGIGVTRIVAGRRPVAIAKISDDRFLVANEHSDSLTRLDFHFEGPKVEPEERLPSRDRVVSSKAEISSDVETPVDAGGYSETEQVEYEGEYEYEYEYEAEYEDEETEDELADSSAYRSKSYRSSDDPAVEPVSSDVPTRSYQIGPDVPAGEQQLFVTATSLSLGESAPLQASDRGELLFFDASLSRGGWYSCHSCHTDGHTSGSLADTLSDGGEGAPKRILSLRGVGETGPWAWVGDKSEIEGQVRQTLELTMQGRKMNDGDVADLVAFLESIPPAPTFRDPVTDLDRDLVAKGRHLFETLDCVSCHSGSILTSDATYDVGLKDERGITEFNPPSLRGVGHLHSLFHDLRASELSEVVGNFKHQLPHELSLEQRAQLIRYLESL
ncbi:cytochrome c peroxidase [Rhodopirellula sp. P2]|uniref:cytochrome c peroxidase n=1 Tax=Rhodopirellula sp. P2 TaxID=2127060 RepID=UPI0023688ECE|nr:cytochrome c peroxidase [Rhodopirellula sp. P2]WDQ15081.1 methylamine utilization protein MauG [Rhodopirellula sp. P2]